MNDYTPTQQRLLSVLADGLSHTRAELRACINDELAGPGALWSHLHLLRKRLRPSGEDVICELRNGRIICYRHVRLLASSTDGKR